VRRIVIALAATLAVVLATDATQAEHEVYYRYTLLGYVKDAHGQPLRSREIRVIRDKTGFAYFGETDATGLYVIVVRLGDESLGEHLTLRSAANTMKVTVRFDVTNRSDERGTRIDLDGTQFVERAAWFRPTLTLLRDAARR
jgi:hypothetical protein